MPTVWLRNVSCEAAECNHVRTVERGAFVGTIPITKGLDAEDIYVSIKDLTGQVNHCTPAILTPSLTVSNITNPMLLSMSRLE